jgi:hypothetical protein
MEKGEASVAAQASPTMLLPTEYDPAYQHGY